MLGTFGLTFLAVCFVSQSSARTAVTLLTRDYSYVRPNEVLVSHIRTVLDRMVDLKVTVHPRIRHLFELLKKDIRQGADYGQLHHVLNFDKTEKPKYDVNKLNRIFTTTTEDYL